MIEPDDGETITWDPYQILTAAVSLLIAEITSPARPHHPRLATIPRP